MSAARLTALLAIGLAALAAASCRRDAAPATDGRTAAWMDISPSYGDPPRDPGDALALLQAYGSGRLALRGVSVTFGNVPLVRGYPVAHELMSRIDTGLLRPWRGASSPEERAAPTEATELLEEALRKEPLTVLVLGPATTLASVLQRRAAAASRIERVIVVGGRRQGDATTEGPAPPTVTSGIGTDIDSLRVLLDSPVAITLVAPDLSTGVGLDARDLGRLEEARGPIRLVLPSARAWLEQVTATAGQSSFAVPAMLAVDVAAHPGELRCEVAMASLSSTPDTSTLVVSSEATAGGRRVTWCHTADAAAKDRILADLMRLAPVR